MMYLCLIKLRFLLHDVYVYDNHLRRRDLPTANERQDGRRRHGVTRCPSSVRRAERGGESGAAFFWTWASPGGSDPAVLKVQPSSFARGLCPLAADEGEAAEGWYRERKKPRRRALDPRSIERRGDCGAPPATATPMAACCNSRFSINRFT
jgi:hypothetical protein